jgi:hypothetical protein
MLLQFTLTKTVPGPVALEALPGCISVSTIAQSPVSRYARDSNFRTPVMCVVFH